MCTILLAVITLVASTITAYFVGTAAARSSVDELVEQHNVERDNTLNLLRYTENQLLLSNKTVHGIYDGLNNLNEEKFISDLVLITMLAIQIQAAQSEKFINALGK